MSLSTEQTKKLWGVRDTLERWVKESKAAVEKSASDVEVRKYWIEHQPDNDDSHARWGQEIKESVYGASIERVNVSRYEDLIEKVHEILREG